MGATVIMLLIKNKAIFCLGGAILAAFLGMPWCGRFVCSVLSHHRLQIFKTDWVHLVLKNSKFSLHSIQNSEKEPIYSSYGTLIELHEFTWTLSKGPYSLNNFFKSDGGTFPFLMEVITAPKSLAVKRHSRNWCLHKPLAMFSTGLNIIKNKYQIELSSQKYHNALKNI